jgi:hypothetical protein
MLFNVFDEAFTRDIDESFKEGSRELFSRSYANFIYDVRDTTLMTEEFQSTEGIGMPSFLDEKEDLPLQALCKGYRVAYSTKEFGDRLCFSYKTLL